MTDNGWGISRPERAAADQARKNKDTRNRYNDLCALQYLKRVLTPVPECFINPQGPLSMAIYDSKNSPFLNSLGAARDARASAMSRAIFGDEDRFNGSWLNRPWPYATETTPEDAPDEITVFEDDLRSLLHFRDTHSLHKHSPETQDDILGALGEGYRIAPQDDDEWDSVGISIAGVSLTVPKYHYLRDALERLVCHARPRPNVYIGEFDNEGRFAVLTLQEATLHITDRKTGDAFQMVNGERDLPKPDPDEVEADEVEPDDGSLTISATTLKLLDGLLSNCLDLSGVDAPTLAWQALALNPLLRRDRERAASATHSSAHE